MGNTQQNDLSLAGFENLVWAKRWLNPDIIIHVKRKIRPDELKEAVAAALEVHPWYQTMVTVNDRHEPTRVKNTEPPIIERFKRDEHILYGTAQYHHYSWLIRYTDHKIVFSISHMLSDGTGALGFIESVLQFYFEKTGDLPATVLPEEIDLASTTENAYLKYGKRTTAPKDKEAEIQASKIPDGILSADKENMATYRIVIEKGRIKELCSEFDVRPVTITSALFSKALAEAAGFSEGIVQVPVPVNCRNYFPSNTDRNFIYVAPLNYDVAKMRSADLKTAAQELNRQFKEIVNPEDMQAFFQEICDFTGVFRQSVEGAYAIRESADNHNDDRTATICYTHVTRTNMPEEFNSLIDSIEIAALPPREGSVVYIVGVNFGDKMTFSVKSIIKGNAFIKHLTRILEQEEIEYALSHSRHKCLAKFYTVE